MVHQKLYQETKYSEDLYVNEYLDTLLQHIEGLFDKNISIERSIDSIIMDMQTITSIGIVVNELVNNAYKHAFQGVEEPKIAVAFTKAKSGYRLTVSDNGVGSANDVRDNQGSSFGLKLVQLIQKQLNAKLIIDQMSPGVSVSLRF